MFSLLFNIFLVLWCTVVLALSAVALLVTFPFDKRRHVVNELSRMLCRVFFAIPPRWSAAVTGLENIRKGERYVIVANHRAMLDIPAMYFIPLDFRWVSKREVFRLPFFGQFLLLHGDICIDRGNATQAMEQLLEQGRKWIDKGVSVAVFPEGTRSKTGRLGRFKPGAFALAEAAQAKILPVVIQGTDHIMTKKGKYFWRNRLKITVLPPFQVTDAKAAAERAAEQMSELLCL